jgi:hypothetical protein
LLSRGNGKLNESFVTVGGTAGVLRIMSSPGNMPW